MRKILSLSLIIAAIFCLCSKLSAVQYKPSQDMGIGVGNQPTDSCILINLVTGEKNVGLIQFDLNYFTGDVAYSELDIYHVFNAASGAKFGLYVNTSEWLPSTLTWNSLPSVESTPCATLVIDDNNIQTWRSMDVTDAVKDWVKGTKPNYGFTIARLDQSNPFVYFCAQDTQKDVDGKTVQFYAPVLEITDSQPVPDSTPTALLTACSLLLLASFRRRQS